MLLGVQAVRAASHGPAEGAALPTDPRERTGRLLLPTARTWPGRRHESTAGLRPGSEGCSCCRSGFLQVSAFLSVTIATLTSPRYGGEPRFLSPSQAPQLSRPDPSPQYLGKALIGPDVLYSDKLHGLGLFLSRLLRPLWRTPLVQRTQAGLHEPLFQEVCHLCHLLTNQLCL